MLHARSGAPKLDLSQYYASADALLEAALNWRSRARGVGAAPVCYAPKALEQATNSWSEDLLQGHGGFSDVFRG